MTPLPHLCTCDPHRIHQWGLPPILLVQKASRSLGTSILACIVEAKAPVAGVFEADQEGAHRAPVLLSDILIRPQSGMSFICPCWRYRKQSSKILTVSGVLNSPDKDMGTADIISIMRLSLWVGPQVLCMILTAIAQGFQIALLSILLGMNHIHVCDLPFLHPKEVMIDCHADKLHSPQDALHWPLRGCLEGGHDVLVVCALA